MKKEQVVLSDGYIKAISYKTGKRRTATAQPKERIIPMTDRARAEFEKLLELSKGENVYPYRSIKKPGLRYAKLPKSKASGFDGCGTRQKIAGVSQECIRWI